MGQWEVAVAALAVVLGLWVVEPRPQWAMLAGALAVWVAVAAGLSRRLGALLTAVAAVAASVVTLDTSARVRSVERSWSAVRGELVERASNELDLTLAATVAAVRSLAARGSTISTRTRDDAPLLREMIEPRGPEQGVVIFDSAGKAVSWAGRHRFRSGPISRELSTRITPFYLVLEARRQARGHTVVAHVVLTADSAVPDQERTIAARFARATGARLEFHTQGQIPQGAEVKHYCEPACLATASGPPPDTLLSVRAIPPSQGSLKLSLLATGARWAAVFSVATLTLLVLFGGSLGRWGGILGIGGLLVLTPAGEQMGAGALFSSATYFLEILGPFSASAGALLLGAGVLALGLLRFLERGAGMRAAGRLLAVMLVVAAPAIVWTFGRGITPPSTGVPMGLWMSWQATLTVLGSLLLMGAAVAWGSYEGASSPPWTSWTAGALAIVLAVLGLALWQPGDVWPVWYAVLWVPAGLLAIQPAPRLRLLIAVAAVAGASASLLTWESTVRGRLLLAERDAGRLSGGDPVAMGMLDRFGATLREAGFPTTAAALYASWRRSPLSREDYPAVLAAFGPDGEQAASLELAAVEFPAAIVRNLADRARTGEEIEPMAVPLESGMHYVIAVPFPDRSAVTVAVGPPSRLIRPVLVARFLRGERRLVAPYDMALGEPLLIGARASGVDWQRIGWTVRGSGTLDVPYDGARHLHVTVSLGEISQLLVRGVLVVFLDVVFLVLLGLVSEGIGRRLAVPAWIRDMGRFRSYRTRLAIALAAFFVIPTLGFAAWSIGRLNADAARSRDLLIQQTLSNAIGTASAFTQLPPSEVRDQLRELSTRFGADLLWYEQGVLTQASAPVLAELGLLSPYLPADVLNRLTARDELEFTTDAVIGGQLTRVGYRSLGANPLATPVLAAPRLVEVVDIQRQQEDLAFGLVLATLLGLGGAVGLAAIAARSLSRPVQSLRSAAEAVGRGDPLPPFGGDVPTEFVSVVDAFERMAHDVEASQAALEAARRRTATVLRNVATGVMALDREMRITIANPRAEVVLQVSLGSGAQVSGLTGEHWAPLWDWVKEFMRSSRELDAKEFVVGSRRVRAQAAILQTDPRGCVVALDDTTELARAVRVLAWGELARQIAHEIKNPLTPIRLGMQHILRARRDGRADFDAALERTTKQVLAEIERLDAIARAFARFGAPPAEAAPLKREDIAAVARDTAQLYTLGGGTDVTVEAEGVVEGLVRKDEVKEVLINLVENARDAGATDVKIAVEAAASGGAMLSVRDNGRGIRADNLPRIFEPQFSTATSGTGLGLAICRRLVESWGGSIAVHSDVGEGTTVRIEVRGAG